MSVAEANVYAGAASLHAAGGEPALAARDLGLDVPRDVSVIGLDGHTLGPVFGLTTVDQFAHQQGERAVEAVLAELRGEALPAGELPAELVVRSSTAFVTNAG